MKNALNSMTLIALALVAAPALAAERIVLVEEFTATW
jgi:hypothetical protein